MYDRTQNLTTGTAHRGVTRPAEPFTDDEMNLLMGAMKDSHATYLGCRNVAALMLLWRGGIRVQELLEIRSGDVNWITGNVTVRKGKGGKRRTTRVDQWALAYMQEWEMILPENAEVFICRRDGKPMAQSAVRMMLARAGERAGITHPVRPHGLRHRFAVELARENIPLPFISKLLGHTNIATTATYLQTLTIEEALDAITNRKVAA